MTKIAFTMLAVLALIASPLSSAQADQTSPSGNFLSLPALEINAKIGMATDQGDAYPHGKNHFRPVNENDQSIIPTLSQYICPPTGCTCMSGATKK